MTELRPQDIMDNLLKHIPKEVREEMDTRDAVYIIESPSPEDLLHGRNEGDALSRILKLAEIDTYYFFAASEETFEQAFKLIGETIKNRSDFDHAMPWIHISAHGGRDGLELTDGGVIHWEILNRILAELHTALGPSVLPPPLPQKMPKASLCLSSCGAFQAYQSATGVNAPIQYLVGANRDVGWCQALIAFSCFYYLTGIQRKPVNLAIMSMNMGSGAAYEDQGPIFEAEHFYDERAWTIQSTETKAPPAT